MKKLLIGCLLVSSLAWAQTPKDTTFALFKDDFFNKIEPSIETKRDEIIKTNAGFWKEFTEKFAVDFDRNTQYKRIIAEPNTDKFEMAIFGMRRKQADFYKNHAQYAQLSDDLKALVEAHIRYNYWHLLLAYPILRGNAETNVMKVYSLPNVMLESLDAKKIVDDNLLMAEPFRYFLSYYVTYYNSKNRQFEKYRDMGMAMNDKAALAGQQLKGGTLRYYLTRLLVETCANTPAEAIKQTLAQLSALPQATAHASLAQTQCQEAINKKPEPKPMLKPDQTGYELVGLDGNTFFTGSLKGKYVYVDFWASWCGPCRQEMPFSKALQEKLTPKQKEKLVFLNISIDERKENWLKAVETLKLEGINGWSPDIGGRLKIQSIPRYMIIDPQGNIMNPNASRPSSPTIFSELLQLIEK